MLEKMRKSLETEVARFSKKTKIALAVALLGLSFPSSFIPNTEVYAQTEVQPIQTTTLDADGLQEIHLEWAEMEKG